MVPTLRNQSHWTAGFIDIPAQEIFYGDSLKVASDVDLVRLQLLHIVLEATTAKTSAPPKPPVLASPWLEATTAKTSAPLKPLVLHQAQEAESDLFGVTVLSNQGHIDKQLTPFTKNIESRSFLEKLLEAIACSTPGNGATKFSMSGMASFACSTQGNGATKFLMSGMASVGCCTPGNGDVKFSKSGSGGFACSTPGNVDGAVKFSKSGSSGLACSTPGNVDSAVELSKSGSDAFMFSTPGSAVEFSKSGIEAFGWSTAGDAVTEFSECGTDVIAWSTAGDAVTDVLESGTTATAVSMAGDAAINFSKSGNPSPISDSVQAVMEYVMSFECQDYKEFTEDINSIFLSKLMMPMKIGAKEKGFQDKDPAIDSAMEKNPFKDKIKHMYCLYHLGMINWPKSLKGKLSIGYTRAINLLWECRNAITQTAFNFIWNSL
ncbi:hypothetical protein BJ741DRAFT_689086 [Chytriomyces cf. hyalinus JEL632]|nr:hypothetical protein BJ741DRAFT_689086 [Chytriomyces cf. hyalinus JEL632]